MNVYVCARKFKIKNLLLIIFIRYNRKSTFSKSCESLRRCITGIGGMETSGEPPCSYSKSLAGLRSTTPVDKYSWN